MRKVIVFFGGDSQVGTSMIARSLAEELANRGGKVLFVLSSGKLDKEIKSQNSASIDNLKAGICSQSLKESDINMNIVHVGNLDFIPGVKNPYMVKYFPENTINVLSQNLKEKYDFMIIDGGDNPDIGLNISALVDSDDVYFVVTQREKTLRRFNYIRENVLNPLDVTGKIIINMYMKGKALYSEGEIEKICKMERILQIPFIEYGWEVEMEGKTLMGYERFKRQIKSLADNYIDGEERNNKWKITSRWKSFHWKHI